MVYIVIVRVVHSSFGLGVSGQYKITFCVYIVFYIIVNHFWSRVKSGSVTRLGKYQAIGYILIIHGVYWCLIDWLMGIGIKFDHFVSFSEELKHKKEMENRRPLQDIGNVANFNNVPITKY